MELASDEDESLEVSRDHDLRMKSRLKSEVGVKSEERDALGGGRRDDAMERSNRVRSGIERTATDHFLPLTTTTSRSTL